MNKVAIVGVEGSGKTVLKAAVVEKQQKVTSRIPVAAPAERTVSTATGRPVGLDNRRRRC
jgi:molybdopterin-guanine dinucleotide biosynthesis protein